MDIPENDNRQKLNRINNFIQALCGLYSRVGQRLGVTRSFVSRVARGERKSPEVERALIQEFDDLR
jgi:hypothetical protein